MPDMTVAARDLRSGDILPGEGEISTILKSTSHATVTVELDSRVLRGPWNHGDPVHIYREEKN